MSRSADSEDEADSHVPLLADHDHRSFGDSAHAASRASLLSPLSGQSQEVKYVFEPCISQTERERDSYSDYSHISVRSKAPYLRDGPYPGRPPPPYYNHYGRNSAANFQYGFQPGVAAATNVQRFRLQQQTVSLEDVSRQDSARRTSWSPAFVAPGYQVGRKDVRVCQNGNGIEWNSFQHAAYTGGQDYNKNGVEWDSFKHAAYNGQSQTQNQVPAYFQNGKSQSYVPPPTASHLQHKSPQSLEKQADCVPPRLAPVSGVLSEKASKNLIRPVAFKPSSTTQGNTNICQHCGKEISVCGGCASFGPSVHQGKGFSPVHPASTRYNTEFFNEAAFIEDDEDDSPGVNVDQSPTRKASSACSSTAGFWGTSEAETPSPSDSGVCELEAMLKEREAEILTLRQVMDRNERAIFQVYEEKKSKWLQDMREIKEEYEHKLKVQQQKATKLEQALASQVRRLQQEKQQLAGKFSDLQADQDGAVRHSQDQLDSCCSNSETSSLSLSSTPKKASTRSSPEDLSQFPTLQGQMAMKNTEIMALRSQLQTLHRQLEEKAELLSKTHEEVSSRTEELELVREQLDQLSGTGKDSVCEESTQTYISDLNSELGVHRPGVISEEEYTLSLERQIDALREQVQTAEALVETERLQWVEEKNKVIRYQKQLQLNYVQMQRKNIALEAEVEQLTMELESREMNLAAVNGEEESVC